MKTVISYLAAVLMLACSTAHAAGFSYDMSKSTPEGSWQIREDIETNRKGKRSGSTIKSSLLGSEMRDGEKHYWVEMAVQSFKISKKGKRKNTGERAIIKSLLPARLFSEDPANVMSNLKGFGVETIIQNGDEDPMRMGDTSGLLGGVMAATQAEIVFDFENQGRESVEVAAGKFDVEKIQGSGSVSMKIVFKKMEVQSDTTMWVSSKVPFGTVKIEGTTTTNGKVSTHTSELLEFGQSGAVSEITKEPKDMPQMPNIFGG